MNIEKFKWTNVDIMERNTVGRSYPGQKKSPKASPATVFAFQRYWQNYTLLEQKGMVFDIFINC